MSDVDDDLATMSREELIAELVEARDRLFALTYRPPPNYTYSLVSGFGPISATISEADPTNTVTVRGT